MTKEQKIKGILVEFFRNGTNCDYLNALNIAIRDIEALSQHDVSECVHPLAELVSGDEGLFCCKCQKYVRSDAHIHNVLQIGLVFSRLNNE